MKSIVSESSNKISSPKESPNTADVAWAPRQRCRLQPVCLRVLRMPHTLNADRCDNFATHKRRVTNCADNNASSRRRGDLTVCTSDEPVQLVVAGTGFKALAEGEWLAHGADGAQPTCAVVAEHCGAFIKGAIPQPNNTVLSPNAEPNPGFGTAAVPTQLPTAVQFGRHHLATNSAAALRHGLTVGRPSPCSTQRT